MGNTNSDGKRLFVAGLPYSFTDKDLTDLFSEFGKVAGANIIMDRDTGKSKGFGFVELDSVEGAESAIAKLDKSMVQDRNIVVNVARPKEERPRTNFGGDNRNYGGRDNNRNKNYDKTRGGRW